MQNFEKLYTRPSPKKGTYGYKSNYKKKTFETIKGLRFCSMEARTKELIQLEHLSHYASEVRLKGSCWDNT